MKKKIIVSILFCLFLIFPFFAENWYVCVSSFRVLDNAIKFQNELNEKNIQNIIVEYDLENNTLYRVFIDKPFDSRDKARNYINTVQKLPEAKYFNFTGLWVCAKTDDNIIPLIPYQYEPEEAPVPEEEFYVLETEEDFYDDWIAGTWEGHFVFHDADLDDNEEESDIVHIYSSDSSSTIKGWNGGTLSDFVNDLLEDIAYLKTEENYIFGDKYFYLSEDLNTFGINIYSNISPDYYCEYTFTRK